MDECPHYAQRHYGNAQPKVGYLIELLYCSSQTLVWWFEFWIQNISQNKGQRPKTQNVKTHSEVLLYAYTDTTSL